MARLFLSVCTVLVVAVLGRADDEGSTTLYPAPLPSPALKFRLLPDLRSQTTGDALPLYKEAVDKFQPLLNEASTRPGGYRIPTWVEKPLPDFPREEVRKTLEPFKDVLELVDKAARRERCLGDAPDGQSKDSNAPLLGQPYYLNELGSILALRARLEIADGNLTAALHTVQTGLAFAKHIGELERLRYGFSGPGIAQLMLRQLDDFVQQPKAPNLYWALTDLPRPLIDERKAVEQERLAMHRRFPGVAAGAADLNAGPLTDEQVQACVQVLLRYYRRPRPLIFELDIRSQLTKRLTDNYEEFKKVLLDQGRPKDKVEAMSYVQVALLAKLAEFDSVMDEQMKWYNEPYSKVADRLEVLDQRLKSAPEAKKLYAAEPMDLHDVHTAKALLERKINILRCLEAVRAYAAGRDGKLPASLDDIKDVPIPIDPVTGKAFVYQVTGDHASLEAPPSAGEGRRYFSDLAYEITIKQR
jgi:hypothetical protein